MDVSAQIIKKKQEEDITMHIANGLRQVKLAKEGKIRLDTLDNLLHDI